MPLLPSRRYRFTPAASKSGFEIASFTQGLNTRDPEQEVIVRVANNVRFGAVSGFSTAKGTIQKGEQIGTGSKIWGLHSYVKKDLSAQLMASYNTDVYRYTESNTPATIVTSTNAQAVGYSKDRNVFFTNVAKDVKGNSFLVAIYQDGSGLKLEWEDTPYNTWTNTAITIDSSTQIGFSGYMDANDTIHLVYMDTANSIKYVKLTYASGPTWSVGTTTLITGTGSSDQAIYPSIFVQSGGRVHVAYRYYNGSTYRVQAKYSDDSGITWIGSTDLSTPSSNTTHSPQLITYNNIPFCIYQVGEVGQTSYYWKTWSGGVWSSQNTLSVTALSTVNSFSAIITGTSLFITYNTVTSGTGVSYTAFGVQAGAQLRQFEVINDGVNDNDIQYKNTINGATDTTATRVTSGSTNNVYPNSIEYVSLSAPFVPVMFMQGTASPYSIKITTASNWAALGATLTAGKKVRSATFPLTGAGGTDAHYFVNGAQTYKWDGTSLTTPSATGFPIAKAITFFNNRPWFFNLAGIENRSAYGPLGSDGFTGTFPAGNTIDFPEYIHGGIEYQKDVMLVFGVNNIYKVQNFDYSGANVGPEKVGPIPNSYGTLSLETVVQIGYYIYFQSPDGQIRRTNGNYVELVSDIIFPTLAGISKAQLMDAAAGSLNDYYYLAVTDTASSQNNLMIVLDTKKCPDGGFSVDTGKSASVFVTHPDVNNSPQIFYGETSPNNGSVYQMEVGYSLNGQSLEMELQTGLLTMGGFFHKKLLGDMLIVAETAGDYSVTFGWSELSDVRTFRTTDINLATNAPVWGSFTWGSFTWGGKTHVEQYIPIFNRGRAYKFKLSHSGANEPVTVTSISGTYNPINYKP